MPRNWVTEIGRTVTFAFTVTHTSPNALALSRATVGCATCSRGVMCSPSVTSRQRSAQIPRLLYLLQQLNLQYETLWMGFSYFFPNCPLLVVLVVLTLNLVLYLCTGVPLIFIS